MVKSRWTHYTYQLRIAIINFYLDEVLPML